MITLIAKLALKTKFVMLLVFHLLYQLVLLEYIVILMVHSISVILDITVLKDSICRLNAYQEPIKILQVKAFVNHAMRDTIVIMILLMLTIL